MKHDEFMAQLMEQHPDLGEFDKMCAVAAAIGQGVIDLELPKPPPGPPWWDRLADDEPWAITPDSESGSD